MVGCEDRKIVGCASLSRLPRRMKHRGDFAVSVTKEYWNQGIGKKRADMHIDLFSKRYIIKIL